MASSGLESYSGAAYRQLSRYAQLFMAYASEQRLIQKIQCVIGMTQVCPVSASLGVSPPPFRSFSSQIARAKREKRNSSES
jgi:hypothetical protein